MIATLGQRPSNRGAARSNNTCVRVSNVQPTFQSWDNCHLYILHCFLRASIVVSSMAMTESWKDGNLEVGHVTMHTLLVPVHLIVL